MTDLILDGFRREPQFNLCIFVILTFDVSSYMLLDPLECLLNACSIFWNLRLYPFHPATDFGMLYIESSMMVES